MIGKEYNGYMMAGHDGHEGGTMYYCTDENLEPVAIRLGNCENVHLMYTAVTSVSNVPSSGYTLSCVVCKK